MGVLRQIWTIARHSALQAMRMKLVVIMAVFLVVLVPALPFFLKSDNTHEGQIRIIMTYCVYLTSFLLSVLTLFLSCMTLNTEIKHQQIFLVDAKPVSRGTVLLGKWAGVMLINAVLVTAMLGATYGLVRYFGRQWPRPGADLTEYKPYRWLRAVGYTWPKGREDDYSYASLKANLLSARGVRRPPPPDLSAAVDEAVLKLKEKGMMPKQKSEEFVRAQLLRHFAKWAWAVPPRASVKWVITDIPKTKEPLVIDFRHHGDTGKVLYDIPGLFVINETGQPVRRAMKAFRVNKLHTLPPVSSDVVRYDEGSSLGWMEIRYTNYDENGVAALFPFGNGIRVHYRAGSLAENFARAGLVILILLSFIAILGIFASTFLSFPVAVLLCLVVFLVGHLSDLIFTDLLPDLFVFETDPRPPGTPMHLGDRIVRGALQSIIGVFPNFKPFDVVPELVGGQLIEWARIGWCFTILPLIRGGILAALGWYVFRRRELAALTANT